MSKEDTIELTALIDEVLPGNMYRVITEGTNHSLICYMGGKLKRNHIRIIRGDRVKIEISPYDLSKGRVTYRL